MSFQLDIPNIPQLERETIDGVRHYVCLLYTSDAADE